MVRGAGGQDKVAALLVGKAWWTQRFLCSSLVTLLLAGQFQSGARLKRMSKRLPSAESRNDNNISSHNISTKSTNVNQIIL